MDCVECGDQIGSVRENQYRALGLQTFICQKCHEKQQSEQSDEQEEE